MTDAQKAIAALRTERGYARFEKLLLAALKAKLADGKPRPKELIECYRQTIANIEAGR